MKHVDLTEVTVTEGEKYNGRREECIMESIKRTNMTNKNIEILISVEINI
jgi:hypothetical protein